MDSALQSPRPHALSRPLEWLWPGRLAAGQLAILDGDPGVGKSLVSLDLAARFSSASELPDGHRPSEPATVLVLSAEDSVRDIIVPRLIAAGADLNNVRIFDRFADKPFVLEGDCDRLLDAIEATKARLVVFDPFFAFLGCEASGLNEFVIRRVLDPLERIAYATRATILLIRHLSKCSAGKQAIHRGFGSIALLAMARTAFLIARLPTSDSSFRARIESSDASPTHVLACTKNNLAPMCPSLGYRIVTGDTGAPQIRWTGVVDRTADDLIAPRPHSQAVPQAVAFLQKHLAQGPRPRHWLVKEAADNAALSLRSLERAKAQLGIVSEERREDERNVWYWSMPIH